MSGKRKKFRVRKRGIFIYRLAGEDVFHVEVNGSHRTDLCGLDYLEVKRLVKQEFPARKFEFRKQPWTTMTAEQVFA